MSDPSKPPICATCAAGLDVACYHEKTRAEPAAAPTPAEIVRAIEQARDLLEQHAQATHKVLRDAGWTHSSSHPGGRWLWSGTLNGKVYTCDDTTALQLLECWAYANDDTPDDDAEDA